jgi:hypothetical protein
MVVNADFYCSMCDVYYNEGESLTVGGFYVHDCAQYAIDSMVPDMNRPALGWRKLPGEDRRGGKVRFTLELPWFSVFVDVCGMELNCYRDSADMSESVVTALQEVAYETIRDSVLRAIR